MIFEALRQFPHSNAADLEKSIGQEFVDRREAMIKSLDELEIPHNAGWLNSNLRQLRLVNWTDQRVVHDFVTLAESIGRATFVQLLIKSPAMAMHISTNPRFAQYSLYWLKRLGVTGFCRFLSGDSVGAAMGDPTRCDDFHSRLQYWFE